MLFPFYRFRKSNDIALVKVSPPFHLGKHVQPINVATTMIPPGKYGNETMKQP